MNKFSENIASSIINNVKKECLIKGAPIPSSCLILSLLRLLALEFRVSNGNEENSKKLTESLIEKVVKFLVSSKSFSIATLKIQIYFNQHHRGKEFILSKHVEKIKQNTEGLLNGILQKINIKNKEDYDQLYHQISSYILFSGLGDAGDNNVLKETIVALKSVLSTKELARFILKPAQSKEKQLADLCRIVTGVKIYNKNCSNKINDMNDLPSMLGMAIRDTCHYLEKKQRDVKENASSFVYLVSQFYTSSWSPLASNLEELPSSGSDTEKQLKSYIIFLQQLNLYLKILTQENSSLNDEFHACFLELQQRLARIRKTVTFRTAIPVIEIYPQFKDLSSTWDKMQEISVRFKNLSKIVSYLKNIQEKMPEPGLGLKISEPVHSDLKTEGEQIAVRLVDTNCELVRPDSDQNFYEIDVQYGGFCAVTFVDTNGILVSGIKEYGLVKYRRLHFCFSSIIAVNQFCQKPDGYIDAMKKIVFIWPETINLLKLEKYLEEERCKLRVVSIKQRHAKNIAIQTDVHPPCSSKDQHLDSNIMQFKTRIERLTRNKNNYQTRSAQTNVSIFRKETSTQTVIKLKK